jgi:hypothetical protein
MLLLLLLEWPLEAVVPVLPWWQGGFDDFMVAPEDLPQHLPTGCYGSLNLYAEHMVSLIDAMILGQKGGPSSTSIVEASTSKKITFFYSLTLIVFNSIYN